MKCLLLKKIELIEVIRMLYLSDEILFLVINLPSVSIITFSLNILYYCFDNFVKHERRKESPVY